MQSGGEERIATEFRDALIKFGVPKPYIEKCEGPIEVSCYLPASCKEKRRQFMIYI
jgi:hypothetical protein